MRSNPIRSLRNMAFHHTSNTARPIGNGVGQLTLKEALVLAAICVSGAITNVLLLLGAGTWWQMILTVAPQVWMLYLISSSFNKKPAARPKASIKESILR